MSKPRLVMHAGVALLVAGTVVFGSSPSANLSADSLFANRAGLGAVLDNTAAANAASTIAAKTNLAVSTDAANAASKLNSQVALPTAGDDFLAKRQVVATAGNGGKGILTYTVQPGDTLGAVASNFNVTSNTIRWANNLDGDMIKPGQQLTILPITGILYTIESGDTPEALATKYQSNAAQIISFNDAEVKGLQVGQKIIIPDGVIPQASPKPATPAQQLAPQLTRYAFSGNGYAFGYCTWYVASRRAIPGNWGNAYSWYYNAQASGFGVGRTPAPGAIAWTPFGYYGHVALVEQVSGNQVLVSDMNYNGNWNRVTTRWTSLSEWGGFIY